MTILFFNKRKNRTHDSLLLFVLKKGGIQMCVYILYVCLIYMWGYSNLYAEYVWVYIDDPWKDTEESGSNCCLWDVFYMSITYSKSLPRH